MKYILYAILIYLAYQFIFNLVVPVYRTSRKLKKGFREMHARMQGHMNQQQGHSPSASPGTSAAQSPAGDYIDFEETK